MWWQPGLGWPGLAERTGATAEAQVEKAPRTRRQCAGLAGARAANLSASRAKDVAESLARERWGNLGAFKGRGQGEREGQMRANLVERLDRGLDDLAQLRLWMDEWMVRRWESGWASTKVWSVGTALLVGAREDQVGGSEGLGAAEDALKH